MTMKRLALGLVIASTIACEGTATKGHVARFGVMQKTETIKGRYWQVRFQYPVDIDLICIETGSSGAVCRTPAAWTQLTTCGVER